MAMLFGADVARLARGGEPTPFGIIVSSVFGLAVGSAAGAHSRTAAAVVQRQQQTNETKEHL